MLALGFSFKKQRKIKGEEIDEKYCVEDRNSPLLAEKRFVLAVACTSEMVMGSDYTYSSLTKDLFAKKKGENEE